LRAKRKTILLGLLSQMTGRREGDELVISCRHKMVLERLREEDRWPVLVEAVEEAAGTRLGIRLESGNQEAAAGPFAGEPLRKKALSDPLVAEVLREFDGASVVEVRPAPAGSGADEERDAAEPEPVDEEREEGGG